MYYFDNFYPEGDNIINLTEASISESIVRASTCERVSITIDNIPESREVVIPVRIIEGMERVMDRGTVSEKQNKLLIMLCDLLNTNNIDFLSKTYTV